MIERMLRRRARLSIAVAIEAASAVGVTLAITLGNAAALAQPIAASAAQAPQELRELRIRDGDTTIVRVSQRDQTRLRVVGGRVLEVIGDVHDAERNATGRVLVLRDEAAGEVYLQPRPAATGLPLTPVKLDVKTDRGTVGLLLHPADIIGDTLTLQIQGGATRSEDTASRARSAGHVRALKAMTLALANPELAPDLAGQFVADGSDVRLWAEARFVRLGHIETPQLLGERYELTNLTAARMVLDERELFAADVLSVSIQRLDLAPGEATLVWVVRRPARER